ncbi:MAG: Rrf2 family transcriptional regulator [Kiritimatiellaeota bacterium]|nr:Rrf2 family transcriptional regulator [Kiritimatiellota bacterium]
MKISTKGRYALRMMIDVANHGKAGMVSVKDISERQGVSVKYLEQIAATLVKSGLLRSGRGANGGYMLSKSPDQYKAGDILRVTEGKLAPIACLEADVNPCERQAACPTLSFWKGFHRVIDHYVDSVTLRDFVVLDDNS